MLLLVAIQSMIFAVGVLAKIQCNVSEEVCEVSARTTTGWVCGTREKDIKGGIYASFLNVPYAKQPVGELRFKELQPAEPWQHLHDSTKVGPICHQIDFEYGPLMTNWNMSEACIHANIYVPLRASLHISEVQGSSGLPVLVFVHGGGFSSGSGDPDIYGPEYLMPEDIIVITFNYRINIIGYISLNTSSIPGNNGIRDILTFLNWVKDNARFFGGNPNDVTLGGHSTGGSNAHLIVLSKAAEGLFKRAILLSGVALHSLYTPSPENAKEVAKKFVSILGINSTDPEEISQELIATPIDKIMNATAEFQTQNFPNIFVPIVEQSFPGITTVIGTDPEKLLLGGQGKNIPLLIGFTNKEEQFLLQAFKNVDILSKVKENPLDMLSPDLVRRLPRHTSLEYANETEKRYFMGDPTVEKFGVCYGDYGFRYPAITLQRLKQKRAMTEAPTFLYEFSYNLSFSVVKETKHIQYNGAAHYDDLSLIFRTNSMKGKPGFENPSARDLEVREQMIKIIRNFIYCDDPKCSPHENKPSPYVKYLDISRPNEIQYSYLTQKEKKMVRYYDTFWKNAGNLQ